MTRTEMIFESLAGRFRKDEPMSSAKRKIKYTFICRTRSSIRPVTALGLRSSSMERYLSKLYGVTEQEKGNYAGKYGYSQCQAVARIVISQGKNLLRFQFYLTLTCFVGFMSSVRP